MTIKLQIVVQSHLSDAILEIRLNPSTAKVRMKFVKWLLLRYSSLNTEINAEEEYELFKQEQS